MAKKDDFKKEIKSIQKRLDQIRSERRRKIKDLTRKLKMIKSEAKPSKPRRWRERAAPNLCKDGFE